MTSRFSTALALLLAAALVPAVAAAQEGAFEQVENPFQREYDYQVGEDLWPGVEAAGLQWHLLNIFPKDPDDVRPGRPVTTYIRLGFENTTDRTLNTVAVILFEDEMGNALDRVEISEIRVPAGDNEVIRQKEKLQSDLLLATSKLYVFWEVQAGR